MTHRPLVVLDDDPTGTQSVAGVTVVLDWSDQPTMRAVVGHDAVYVLTNSRALDPRQAYETVFHATRAFLERAPSAQILLRGDSTLRGHLLEEYLAVRDALATEPAPPYVIVPAFPEAGRVTVNGIHQIERDGTRVPLDRTEYSRDAAFNYASSHLLTWGEERSRGFFKASAGAGLTLAELRSGGPSVVADAVRRIADAGDPAIFAPDAETLDDLRTIGQGIRLLAGRPEQPIVRAAPALAAVLSGYEAAGLVPRPSADDRVLVICGSHVPTSTRQLRALELAHPGVVDVADLDWLDSDDAAGEIARLARNAEHGLGEHRLAVIATPRAHDPDRATLSSSRRIATNLAMVLHEIGDLPHTIIAKGGITSAVIARVGLGARSALAVGPVAPGVALWRVDSPDGAHSLVIFPGNVGTEDALALLVERLQDR